MDAHGHPIPENEVLTGKPGTVFQYSYIPLFFFAKLRILAKSQIVHMISWACACESNLRGAWFAHV